MRAKGKRVIVRKLDLSPEARTEQGLVLPGGVEALGAPPVGIVVSVGPRVGSDEWCEACGAAPGVLCGQDTFPLITECRERPQALSDGDMVLYHRYGGTEVTLDGVELLVLHEDEILAGFDEEEARAAQKAHVREVADER